MKFNFTSHAKMRLEERGIWPDDIKTVIRNSLSKTREADLIVAVGLVKGRALCVIYRYEKSNYKIITAYYN